MRFWFDPIILYAISAYQRTKQVEVNHLRSENFDGYACARENMR
jgi:hypothetical protein